MNEHVNVPSILFILKKEIKVIFLIMSDKPQMAKYLE